MSNESKAWRVEYVDAQGRTIKTRLSSVGLQTEDDVRKYVDAAGGKLVSVTEAE